MNKKNIVWGSILILVGIIVGLNSLGYTHITIFFKGWWTLFIIIPSIAGLFSDNVDKSSNIIGLIIGIILLLGVRNIIDFELIGKLIFPAILILIGLSFLFKERVKIPNKKNESEYYATFSSQNINVTDTFEGADLNAIFGGLKFDLRESKIKNEPVIKASAIFGGITILVPKNTTIKCKSTSIFGGVSNKCKNNDSKNIIYIETLSLFGGVDINEIDSEND